MAGAHDPAEHVIDQKHHWEFFDTLFGTPIRLPILHVNLFGYDFYLTKFMLLELLAAGLLCAIYIPLARRIAGGGAPRGTWWNFFEVFLTFVRDQIAHPCLAGDEHHAEHDDHGAHGTHEHADHGHHAEAHGHPADRFVPFLWTLFLFVLFLNLLGMVPFLGSPTSSIWVTGGLALCSFAMMHGAAVAKMGVPGYLKSLWPAIDVPFVLAVPLKPMIFVIEVMGTVIKAGVLAVRLFANMFAGHMVVATILSFITLATASLVLWAGVTAASVLGVVALSLLELFVAFLQAYIFTFLTALFMGMALHPQH